MPRFARCVFAVFLAVSCLTSSLTCQAAAPETAAAAFILMEAGSGRVLSSRNETQERSIASTTKIMTALVALETGNLSDKVTVKQNHLKEGSSMYLRAGEVLTLEELLYGLLLPSGNDAAECIAAHCGGSGGSGGSAQFVRWMNEKAKALGMEHTSFANPSGLDEMGHSSCALDMARLAAYAMQNPTFARIVSTRTASVGTRTMTNHNKLLASYSGCIGLKTGYTGDAGRTLVTCAERGGMRMIAVTLHDGSDWADHAALYDYGFSAYALSSGAKKGEAYGSVSVDGQSVSAVAAESFRYPTAENACAPSCRKPSPPPCGRDKRSARSSSPAARLRSEELTLSARAAYRRRKQRAKQAKISRWRKSSGNFCRQSKGGIDLAEARIQKLIAESGLCSRRTAEQWIAAGRVCVKGTAWRWTVRRLLTGSSST